MINEVDILLAKKVFSIYASLNLPMVNLSLNLFQPESTSSSLSFLLNSSYHFCDGFFQVDKSQEEQFHSDLNVWKAFGFNYQVNSPVFESPHAESAIHIVNAKKESEAISFVKKLPKAAHVFVYSIAKESGDPNLIWKLMYPWWSVLENEKYDATTVAGYTLFLFYGRRRS
jgi:hypothetical protein